MDETAGQWVARLVSNPWFSIFLTNMLIIGTPAVVVWGVVAGIIAVGIIQAVETTLEKNPAHG